MVNKSGFLNFMKYFSVPLLIGIGAFSFAVFMAVKETKLSNLVVNEALGGNSSAIQFLNKYEKPWKNEQIVREAVKGNKYALKILKIGDENKEPSR